MKLNTSNLGSLFLLLWAPVVFAGQYDLTYRADIWSNTIGGLQRGTVYLDHLAMTLDFTTDWQEDRGMRFLITGIYNNGRDFSPEYTGDLQVASNIETGAEALRL